MFAILISNMVPSPIRSLLISDIFKENCRRSNLCQKIIFSIHHYKILKHLIILGTEVKVLMAVLTSCDEYGELKEYLWKGTYSNVGCWEESEGNNLVSKEKILEEVFRCLEKPPSSTVVRINLLQSSLEEAKLSLENYLKKEYCDKSLPCPEVKLHQKVPDILLVSSQNFQMKFTSCSQEVIVGSQCGTAVLRGANVFAPGVMAAHSGMKRGDKVSVYSDVDGQCRRGYVRPFHGRKIFVGNGITEMARNEIFCTEIVPRGVAIRMIEPLYDSPPLSGFSPHSVFLQNLPSVVASHVLAPKPGETVLDMCAAPGGKTTHIGQIMENKGTIFALDKSKPKVEKIVDNVKKLRLTSVRPFVWDATKAVRKPDDGEEAERPPFPPLFFDRILLDGPCSALGQRPQHLFKKSTKELESFPVYQKKLLTVAEKLLKPGGTLVYSTCTICSEENERQVAWALERFSSLQLARQDMHIGGFGIKNCGLTEEQRQLVQRFDPLDMDRRFVCLDRQLSDCDTIGFFIAKFVKKGKNIE